MLLSGRKNLERFKNLVNRIELAFLSILPADEAQTKISFLFAFAAQDFLRENVLCPKSTGYLAPNLIYVQKVCVFS